MASKLNIADIQAECDWCERELRTYVIKAVFGLPERVKENLLRTLKVLKEQAKIIKMHVKEPAEQQRKTAYKEKSEVDKYTNGQGKLKSETIMSETTSKNTQTDLRLDGYDIVTDYEDSKKTMPSAIDLKTPNDCQLSNDKSFRNQQNLLREKDQHIQNLNEKLNLADRKYKDLSMRFGALASAAANTDNQRADCLVTAYRPESLASMYVNDLYNQLWPEALSRMEKLDCSEKASIDMLRRIVEKCFTEVSTRVGEQMTKYRHILRAILSIDVGPRPISEIVEEFSSLIKQTDDNSDSSQNTDPTMSVMLGHIRDKQTSLEVGRLADTTEVILKSLKQIIGSELGTRIMSESAIREYVSECVKISWFMSVQDPPMFIDCEMMHGNRRMLFDEHMHRCYNKQGKYVESVVWPPLYYSRGGKVAVKAFVKCCDT